MPKALEKELEAMSTIQGKLLCKRCAYEWSAQAGVVPKSCPRCKSYKWNVDRKRKEVKI